MKPSWWTLRRWAVTVSPAILPVLATVAVALTAAYYAADQASGQPSPSGWVKYLSWSRHMPEWLTRVLLMVLLAGSLAFIACQTALKYRVGANVASVAGVATTAALIWAPQLCDQTGGIIVGLAIAGVILAGAVGVRTLKDRGLRRSLRDWWSNSATEQTSIGTVQFAQIGVALYMGTIALMAIANAVPAESRWAVLAFSGIGITAASTISEQGGLKNFLAVVGSGIALLGSFVEMDRVLAMGNGDTTAVTVLLAAGVVIYVPFTALALRWRHWGRILIAPMLVAGLVFPVTLVATGVPAILISIGCKVEPEYIAALILASGLTSVVTGVAVLCFGIASEFRRWWEDRKGSARNVKE